MGLGRQGGESAGSAANSVPDQLIVHVIRCRLKPARTPRSASAPVGFPRSTPACEKGNPTGRRPRPPPGSAIRGVSLHSGGSDGAAPDRQPSRFRRSAPSALRFFPVEDRARCPRHHRDETPNARRPHRGSPLRTNRYCSTSRPGKRLLSSLACDRTRKSPRCRMQTPGSGESSGWISSPGRQ